MHILFICGEAPTAARQRPHGLIGALARRGHSVTLVFADRAGTAFDDLAERCGRVVPVRRHQLASAVEDEARAAAYDVAHVDRSALGLVAGPLALPSVADAAISASARAERSLPALGALARAAWGTRIPALRRGEAALLARFERVVVAAEGDARALRGLSGAAGARQGGVHVVPSPIDLERLEPPLRLRDPATLLLDLRDLRRAEASAALGALGAALPGIWAQRAEVRLVVIGQAPLGGAGRLAGDPRVVFAGPLHDPRGHLTAATAVVAPLAPAWGPPHTALEALATGAALIAAGELARDLGAAPGEELLVADTPAELAHAALALLDDAPFRGRVGQMGRRLVMRCHGWERAAAALEDVYAAATGSAIAEWRLEVGLGGPRPGE